MGRFDKQVSNEVAAGIGIRTHCLFHCIIDRLHIDIEMIIKNLTQILIFM